MTAPADAPVQARSLERRRLQCYLALIVADLGSLFVGFGFTGFLYLGTAGFVQASVLWQLVIPVFLTVALYNGSYSMAALLAARDGALRAIAALAISSAVVVFIAFYTKSTQEFSRFLFAAGSLLSVALLLWMRLQMRSFVRWRCGTRIINEVVIEDGGPPVAIHGARRIDAAALGLRPRLDDPDALNRIGMALHTVDRVVISCRPERRVAWAMILRGANVAGEVLDETVAELGAHGARIAGGHGLLRVSVGPLGLRSRVMKRLF
ncbi:MAG: sugar transferase, partial [Novosphingobium sp.]|nr:sugar transferase [Novosphingobium sp.]